MHTYAARVVLPVLLLGVCLLTTGCLKTRITTDLPSSSQTVELDWAHGFVYGLVPPVNGPLAVGDQCTNGISEVYFRQPFVHVLAQGLTGSLYSPQAFTVTCASGPTTSAVSTPPDDLLRNASAESSPRLR